MKVFTFMFENWWTPAFPAALRWRRDSCHKRGKFLKNVVSIWQIWYKKWVSTKFQTATFSPSRWRTHDERQNTNLLLLQPSPTGLLGSYRAEHSLARWRNLACVRSPTNRLKITRFRRLTVGKQELLNRKRSAQCHVTFFKEEQSPPK